MKNKLLILTIALSFCHINNFAQTAMGQWRTHFAYNSVTMVAQTENKVYAVSDGALFSVDKLDNNTEIYSKITGLNGTIISALKYDDANKQLIIGYNNGNIDIMTNGGIINIPDFHNKVMTVNKNINHITIHDNKAYLSCNFGIIVLNLQRKEIAETYYIGANASERNVINTAIVGNEIYALSYTSDNTYYLYKADLNNSNLVNYANWTQITPLPASTSQAIASFAGKLFIQSGWRLYQLEANDSWSVFALPNNSAAASGISVSQNKMIVANEQNNIYIVDDNLNVLHLPNIVQYARAGEYDATNNTYWFAGGEEGIVSYNANTTFKEQFKPDGPAVNTPWSMTFAGEKLFVVPGGAWVGFEQRPAYIMIYDKGQWTNIKASNPINGEKCQDFVSIAIDPFDNTHFFAASYSSGLYEYKNNTFDRYHNYTNSAIETVGGYQYQMLDGAVFDDDGNLWFLNTFVSYAIKVFMRDGTWNKLKYNNFEGLATLKKLHISKKNPNQKWTFSARATQRVLVFDDNGTINDQNDDKSVVFEYFPDPDAAGEIIKPSSYYSIAEDKNGVIWIGTDKGPLLFYNTENVFNAGYTCSRVKIPRKNDSGQADYLLVEETIKAIAIDGANRKWLGTENSGVYLMSENGQETILHFTTDNSPLLSNEIFSIAVNPISGEVFFATGAGLVSYQSDAADSANSLKSVYAYPNPVRENFNGVITITGLVQDTQVKITDLNGNLICKTVSNGSIATWDGKDAYGRKVNTGIYLALCVSGDGADSAIVKILVIN